MFGPAHRFMGSLDVFSTRIGTMNQDARSRPRQRLGVRQSPGAFRERGIQSKAPEDWRTPQPGGESTVRGEPVDRRTVHRENEPGMTQMAVMSQTVSVRWSRVSVLLFHFDFL